MKKIELYRAFVPANKIINDNHDVHYRTHQNNMTWLSNQFMRIYDGTADKKDTTNDFKIPNIEEVKKVIDNNKLLNIYCEIWRPGERRWDPQNYAKTFKPSIDLLVEKDFIQDDSWKYINGVIYIGGGTSVWKQKPFRYKNDGLPDELDFDFWDKHADKNDIMIRVIVESV